MNSKHISSHDLELYYLDKVIEKAQLASLEGHLLECRFCVNRAREIEDYLDVLRSVIARGIPQHRAAKAGVIGDRRSELTIPNNTGAFGRAESILTAVNVRLRSWKLILGV